MVLDSAIGLLAFSRERVHEGDLQVIGGLFDSGCGRAVLAGSGWLLRAHGLLKAQGRGL
jgi:hypothetical protein